jgi:hypothetical protein
MSQSENSTDSRRLDDGTESFIVVNARALSKATKYPAGFVTVEGTISIKFVSEHPFAGDNISLTMSPNKVPSAVVKQGCVLFFHGLAPMRIGQGITKRARNWGEYLGVQTKSGLVIPSFATSGHAMRIDNRWNGDGAHRKGRRLLDVAGW